MLRRRTAPGFLGLAALLLAAGLPAQAAPKELDASITRILQQFHQPGAAIAVVRDGKVVFQQGWGVRTVGRPEKVNEHTSFQVASNSKAMTAAALITFARAPDGSIERMTMAPVLPSTDFSFDFQDLLFRPVR